MKLKPAILSLLLPAFLPLASADLTKLPDWARAHAQAALQEKVPEDAEAWVLLDRTEIAYSGDGEVRVRRLRLARILGERGLSEGTYVIRGLGGSASRVKSLKGWNLREDGELVKLDSDRVVTYDADAGGTGGLSTDLNTGAVLPRVAKGSLVAFESLQVFKLPIGPVDRVGVMEGLPIRRWELEVAKREGWFSSLKDVAIQMDLRHFSPWIPNPEVVPGRSVAASNIPALPKNEGAHPDSYNVLPWILVKFLDPDLASMPSYRTWDSCGMAFYNFFAPRIQTAKVTEPSGPDTVGALRSIHRWMAANLSYKQVYLSPERGWVPEPGPEVVRRRYGDCKDLTACLLGEAKGLGLEVYPALARIVDGMPDPDDPVGPNFNHVISAIRLQKSLGLAAEVETQQGRFLLVDPTDRLTPLGWLGSLHRGHRVLICTDKGGLWVPIPDAAVLRPSTKALLEAQADAKGAVSGTLTLQETGDHLGLRGAALLGGRQKVRDALASQLDLPPAARMDVSRMGDPLDLEHPFEVVVKIEHPDGLHRAGDEATLAGIGLPAAPSVIQKIGEKRRYPVTYEVWTEWDYELRLTSDLDIVPVVPEQEVDTAFRTFTWKAVTRQEGGKSLLTAHFHQLRKPATFGFAELDKGVAEAKKDRRVMLALHSDALAFKLQP